VEFAANIRIYSYGIGVLRTRIAIEEAVEPNLA